MEKCKIIAHRGASSVAPENTIAAFSKAADMGADGFELDIHLTKDGKLVVIHDDDIDRTSNGTGAVIDFSLEELRKFDFNANFQQDYPGEKIPELKDVLELVKNKNLYLNIEVKDIALSGGKMTDMGPMAAELVREMNMEEQIIFSSFNHQSMALLKEKYPEMETALLYFEHLYRPGSYAKTAGASALHPLFIGLDEQLIEEAHSCEVKVHPWTVNVPSIMKQLGNFGVDALITDYPDIALTIRSGEYDPGDAVPSPAEIFKEMLGHKKAQKQESTANVEQ